MLDEYKDAYRALCKKIGCHRIVKHDFDNSLVALCENMCGKCSKQCKQMSNILRHAFWTSSKAESAHDVDFMAGLSSIELISYSFLGLFSKSFKARAIVECILRHCKHSDLEVNGVVLRKGLTLEELMIDGELSACNGVV